MQLKLVDRVPGLVEQFNIDHFAEIIRPVIMAIQLEYFHPDLLTNHIKIPVGLDDAIVDYYKVRGWNEKGMPTTAKLKEVGLEDYVD